MAVARSRRASIPVRHAVLLAAGRGTRLGALSEQTPKCLLPVNGRALLDHQLEALSAAGIDDITIVAGFAAHAVQRHVAGRCRVLVNDDYATTNSITSLSVAQSHLRGHAFLVQNADVLYAKALIERFVESPHQNACLVDPMGEFREGEYHVGLSNGRIVCYSTCVPAERSAGESAQLVRIGERDSDAFFDRLDEVIDSGGAGGFPNQAYDVLMRGEGLWPVFTAGLPWWEVDTPDEYARCCAESAAAPRAAASGAPTPRLTLAHIGQFVRRPYVPWTYRGFAPHVRMLMRRPMHVARQLAAFRSGRLSLEGLDLAVNGSRMLRAAQSAARAAGFEPMLLWGTLLGCIRDGGFIYGDRDIDLGIRHTDVHRLPAYSAQMAARGFRIRKQNEHKLSLVHPRHPRLFIDLDIVRPHRGGWSITNVDNGDRLRFRYCFPLGVFASGRVARFVDGLEVEIPGDAEGFLGAVYGRWATPRAKVDYLYGPLNLELEIAGEPDRVASDGERPDGVMLA